MNILGININWGYIPTVLSICLIVVGIWISNPKNNKGCILVLVGLVLFIIGVYIAGILGG